MPRRCAAAAALFYIVSNEAHQKVKSGLVMCKQSGWLCKYVGVEIWQRATMDLQTKISYSTRWWVVSLSLFTMFCSLVITSWPAFVVSKKSWQQWFFYFLFCFYTRRHHHISVNIRRQQYVQGSWDIAEKDVIQARLRWSLLFFICNLHFLRDLQYKNDSHVTLFFYFFVCLICIKVDATASIVMWIFHASRR